MNLVILTVTGFFAIYYAVQRKNTWMSATLDDWNTLSDSTRDRVQQTVIIILIQFNCCGFEAGDGSAYTGESRSIAGDAFKNQCQDPSNTLLGCSVAGGDGYSYFIGIITAATVIGIITCVLSILAANAARKRRAVVEFATKKTNKGSAERNALLIQSDNFFLLKPQT